MIDLLPTTDQEAIADGIADFLRAKMPVTRLRPQSSSRNPDPQYWRAMGEMGFFSLGLNAEAGGVGGSVIEEVLAFREFGRFLVSPRILGSVIGARVASQAGDADLVSGIISGATPVGLAALHRDVEGFGFPGAVHLIEADAAWFVFWDERSAWLAERADFSDLVPLPGVDGTIQVASARIEHAPRRRIEAAIEPIGRRAALLICATMVGMSEAALAEAVEYVKLREQFGQPIGAFQAVKHRCSDMATRVNAAWSQTLLATACAHHEMRDATFQTIAAKIVATDAAIRNAGADIQNHGGMGFTREVEAHHFLKRAHLLDQVGGDMQLQKKLLMRQAPAL